MDAATERLYNFIRVEKRTVELQLLWEARDFWLLPSNCDPRYPVGSTQGRADIPAHFVKVNAAERLEAAGKLLTDIMVKRDLGDPFPHTYQAGKDIPGKWATVVASCFARTVGEFRANHCHGDLGREVHFYFEHPAAVDLTPWGMACDWVQEQPNFHRKPSGPLVVPFMDAFKPPGLRMEAVGRLTDLPHWTVKAPASLMMRATRAPHVSVNTHGTGSGRRNVFQHAYRQADAIALCEWLGLPWWVYFKPLHSRHTPKGYIRESLKQ